MPNPEEWKKAEAMMGAFFPNLFTGLIVNDIHYQLRRNNEDNIYNIDWGIFENKENMIAAIDTEYKPKWTNGYYPYWSVAVYTWRYNKGEHENPVETCKVRYYRRYPDRTFWMPVRSDYREAGITTGRVIVESPRSVRINPNGFARDIEIFEFPKDDLVFCEILETDIEDYVIEQLKEIGAWSS